MMTSVAGQHHANELNNNQSSNMRVTGTNRCSLGLSAMPERLRCEAQGRSAVPTSRFAQVVLNTLLRWFESRVEAGTCGAQTTWEKGLPMRHTTRFGMAVGFLLCASLAWAQEKKVEVSFGGGFTNPNSEVKDFLGNGYNFNFGVQANVTPVSPAALVAGWTPKGVIDTRPLRDGMERVRAPALAGGPALWIAACDYRTGRRVDVRPPRRTGRRRRCRRRSPRPARCRASTARCGSAGAATLDGGVCSMSNLDLLARARGLDLVVCLNPTSTRAAVTDRSPGGRRRRGAARVFRAQAGP